MKLFPNLFSNYFMYQIPANIILFSKVDSRNNGINTSYMSNIFPCQLGPWIFFSALIPSNISSFPNHVSQIFRVASKPKMVRVHTDWIITRMANTHFFRNFSFMNEIRGSSWRHQNNFVTDVVMNLASTFFWGCVTTPFPAFRFFTNGDKPPKSYFKWNSFWARFLHLTSIMHNHSIVNYNLEAI